MSRSYKKVPMTKESGKGKKEDKRLANRKVRLTQDLPEKGNHHKKFYNQYDICDWKSGEYTWEEVWKEVQESEERTKWFYEQVLKKPYTKKQKNEKELKREFHKMIRK